MISSRIVNMAMVAEVVRNFPEPMEEGNLVDECVNTLMLGLTDSCLKVRQVRLSEF